MKFQSTASLLVSLLLAFAFSATIAVKTNLRDPAANEDASKKHDKSKKVPSRDASKFVVPQFYEAQDQFSMNNVVGKLTITNHRLIQAAYTSAFNKIKPFGVEKELDVMDILSEVAVIPDGHELTAGEFPYYPYSLTIPRFSLLLLPSLW